MQYNNSAIKEMALEPMQFNIMRCETVAPDVYVSYLRGECCQTEIDFFREISSSLQFPWYFGGNWPALDDCMCDLDWLSFSKLIIAIDNFNMVFMGNLEMQNRLINHLLDAVEYWKSEQKTVELWLNKQRG